MSSGYADTVKRPVRQGSRIFHEEAMLILLCTIELEREPPLVHLYRLDLAPA